METARAFGCSRYREGCGFVVWKEVAGVTLTKAQVGRLLKHGVTERIEGFRAKSGRVFAARLKLGEGGKVGFDFSDDPQPGSATTDLAPPLDQAPLPAPQSPRPGPGSAPDDGPAPLTCPKCGQGHIIEGRGAFGCDRYREGCHLVIPKEVGGRRLTQAQLRDLVQTPPDQAHPGVVRLRWSPLCRPAAVERRLGACGGVRGGGLIRVLAQVG